MKYKVGDRVKIKSLDWYNENKNEYGNVDCGTRNFVDSMKSYCSKILTIKGFGTNNSYIMVDNVFWWTDEMIEGLAEEPTVFNGKEFLLKLANIELPSGTTTIWECPDGYIFKDENDNIINATKIILEKKKKEYPKTYEECIGKLSINWDGKVEGYKCDLLAAFQKLLICRDVYWTIAGEEMRLRKPWVIDWDKSDGGYRYCIVNKCNNIKLTSEWLGENYILSFPTEEMRDAFYENFKDLIEQCKELL